MPEVTVTTTDLQAALTAENAEGIEVGHLDSSEVWYEFHTQEDDRVRPSHQALQGTVWRVGDVSAPVPPLDYGCRCFIKYVAKPGSEAAKILPPASSNPTSQAKAWGKWLDDKVPTWESLLKDALAKPIEDRLPTLTVAIQKATGANMPASRDLARMALATEQQGARSPASLKIVKPAPGPTETLTVPIPTPVAPPTAPVAPVAPPGPTEAEKRVAADRAFDERAAAYAKMMAEERAARAALAAEKAKQAALPPAPVVPSTAPDAQLSQERWAKINAIPAFEPKDGLKPAKWGAMEQMNEPYNRTVKARGSDGFANAKRAATANEYLAALKRDEVVPSFAFRSKNLRGLLEKGLLNQHHTGSSGDILNPKKRDWLEKAMFGITKDDPDAHPTYGYLKIGKIRVGVDQYGDIAVRLKPRVLEKTTFTHGDSLDRNYSLATPSGKNIAPHAPASPALEPGVQSFGENGLDQVNYTEAQFHGKITKDDIASIDFVYGRPTPEQEAMLKAAGIPYRHAFSGDGKLEF